MANLYTAWEVRTRYGDELTFNGAKESILRYAEQTGITVKWRNGRGLYGHPPRYHFWEVQNENDALMLMLACGDRVIQRKYLEEQNDN